MRPAIENNESYSEPTEFGRRNLINDRIFLEVRSTGSEGRLCIRFGSKIFLQLRHLRHAARKNSHLAAAWGRAVA